METLVNRAAVAANTINFFILDNLLNEGELCIQVEGNASPIACAPEKIIATTDPTLGRYFRRSAAGRESQTCHRM
jgi:hypothetical protein